MARAMIEQVIVGLVSISSFIMQGRQRWMENVQAGNAGSIELCQRVMRSD
jgi:hypothetical protein